MRALLTEEPPRELATGEVPRNLLPAVRTLPWVVGSSWTYRVTSVLNKTRWTTGLVTERITSARRLAYDVVEVRIERTPSDAEVWDWNTFDGNRAFVVPSGVVLGIGEAVSIDEFRSRAAALTRRRLAWRDGDPLEVLRLPLQAPEQYNYWWRVLGEDSVDTPAGSFAGSYVLDSIMSACCISTHWLVPGVGFVRHELPGLVGAGTMCGYTVYELADYHLPGLVDLP